MFQVSSGLSKHGAVNKEVLGRRRREVSMMHNHGAGGRGGVSPESL